MIRKTVLALICSVNLTAGAAEVTPGNVVTLTASATEQVTQDWLTVNLSVTRDAADAAAVQRQLKQILESALTEARKEASPGVLEVRSGSFQVNPRYGKEGRIAGWQGSAELILAGRDVGKVAALAGKLPGLVVTQTGYSLSRELREQREASLTAAAIQKFRSRAQEIATQFGFKSYSLREVQVQSAEQGTGRPVLFAMRAKAGMADEALAAPMPTEPGTGELSASVQGSIQLQP
jgi:predicted secreted protein